MEKSGRRAPVLCLLFLFALGALAAHGDPAASLSLRPQEVALATQTLVIQPFANNRFTASLAGAPFMDVDLTPYVHLGAGDCLIPENTQLYINGPENYYPLSPNKRLICLLCTTNDDAYAVIVIDLWKKTVARMEMTPYWFCEKLHGLRWVSNTRFVVRALPHDWLFDVANPSASRQLIDEYGLTWDAKRDNDASVYGKANYDMRGSKALALHGGDMALARPRDLSEAIKYDGRFVYPIETQGFPGEWEYPRSGSVIHMPPDKKHPGIDYQTACETVKADGAILPQVHAFSKSAFIADTPWVGFLEQVFPPDKFEPVLETNFVFIDAHRANAVPPKPGEVRIVKIPVESLAPKSLLAYRDMLFELEAKWNDTSKTLEIWQNNAVKIYETSVTFTPGDDGQPELKTVGLPVFHLKGKEYVPILKDEGGVEE